MNILKLVVFSTITILILEYLSKRTIKKVLMLKSYALILNVLIILDMFLMFSLLTKNFQGTLVVVTIIIIIFGIANRIKIDYRQTGFTPFDFLILREAKSMAGALNKKSMLNLVVTALISLLILLILAPFINEPIIGPTLKNSIIIISIVTPLIFYLTGPLYNQKISVFKLGTIFYFFSYLNDPPKIRVSNRKRDLKSSSFNINNAEAPDVIIIQSESFIDPFVLGEHNFNKDPLPFYRTILNESYSFSMSTRAFGGGTVHTEYEILTGLSTVFFPRDTTVFSRYIKDSLPSIGSILNKQGYKSLLIHPYLEWYYNRTNVYKKLGFDRFLTMKSFESKPKEYVKDIDVFNRIIHELDAGNNLIVAVTMQNHTPYNNDLYNNNAIRYHGNFSNSDTKIHFDNFLNGLSETDKSLSYLVDVLKKRKKETILLFYGDHLPVINQDAVFYEESLWSNAKFDSWKYYFDLSKSPGFIWSNRRNITGNIKDIDATAVLPKLLKELNLDFPDYLKKIDALLINDNINGFFRDYLIKDGEFYDSVHPIYKKLYNNIKDINESVFNDAKYDKWCFDNDAYEVY